MCDVSNRFRESHQTDAEQHRRHYGRRDQDPLGQIADGQVAGRVDLSVEKYRQVLHRVHVHRPGQLSDDAE